MNSFGNNSLFSFGELFLSSDIEFAYDDDGVNKRVFLRKRYVLILDSGETMDTSNFTIYNTDVDVLPYLKAALIDKYLQEGGTLKRVRNN